MCIITHVNIYWDMLGHISKFEAVSSRQDKVRGHQRAKAFATSPSIHILNDK